MTDSPCPQQDELLSYMSSQLDEIQADNVSLHIDTCAICNETVSTLNPGADPLVAELQQASPPSFSAEPECAAALNAIADQPPASSAKKSPTTKSPFDLPKTIREYRLIEQIGRGGMGAVFKAEHVRLKRMVAVKVLLGDRLHDEFAIARFNREMEAVGKLDHPNIVRATDAGEDDDTNYLVMELVDGPNLSRISKSLGPIGVADACELVRQAAEGLQHAHEHGLVHRDIKPSNLILADTRPSQLPTSVAPISGNATVKILDLGLALLRENPTAEGDLTSSGQVMGTLDYMAPEQASDTHSVDIRADIYSLGCTLYHLLAGSAPFSGSQYSTILKKMMAHAKTPVPQLSELRSDIPVALSAVLDRMLAKEPADRFSTPGEILAALHPFVGDANLPALLNRYRAAHKSVEHLDTQLQSTITPVSSSLSDTIDPGAQPKSASNPMPQVQTDSQLASE
jgi:serine/threonine protein kinase